MLNKTKNMSSREIITSDLPDSEVVGILSKRVLESELNTPEYTYILTKIFGVRFTFDGMFDVNYEEYVVDKTGEAQSDVVIADFNATSNKVIRDTIEATEQNNVKTKIMDKDIMNFRTNPFDAIQLAFTNTQNITKSQELY
jgi:hypothetical protein